uniref:NaTx n=1 Tax=Centruroides hentzi TaxID=88313 RepID=A0A2I9LPB8_9SCOR
MKSVLVIALIFVLLEIEGMQALDGYLVSKHNCRYECSKLGVNEDCNEWCKEKAGAFYGYCYSFVCYCEGMTKGYAILYNKGQSRRGCSYNDDK